MNTLNKIILVFLVLISAKATAQNISKNQTGGIYNTVRALLLSDTAYATEQSYRLTDDVKYDTDAKGYYAKIKPDGSWPDLDYHTTERSAWRPSWHLYRLMLLVREYHKNADQAYLKAIHRAMLFWISNDFICNNWWQNQINAPYAYSSIILMLGEDATANELNFLNNVLVKRAVQKAPTGQNKIWQHDIEARIALIHHDNDAFALAIKNMQSVINISTSEGIQPDYSFQQHGPMLQFGNYGLHFINSLLFWMKVTANTNFAFGKDKQQMIFDYCTNGIRWSVYKGGMDITAIGRQFRNNADVKRGQNLLVDFALLKSFDNADSCKYALDGLTDNCSINGNKAFWRTDYMINLKGNHYMMSVKTHDTGASKVESINSENMKGAFLNDGVTLIQQTGKEYRNIQPIWKWNMLPGTTSDTTLKPNDADVFKTSNTGLFTGLISDGINGASAFTYKRLGVEAIKSYFFIDGMMVCLGTGIKGTDAKNLVTTVEQNFHTGKTTKSVTAHKQWVWHNNTAYIFMDKGETVKTEINKQFGSWKTIDGASNADVLSDSVFTIYIPHSAHTSYAYIVKPEVDVKEMAKLVQNIPVSILKNTSACQAIQNNNITICIFYEAASIASASTSIRVDKPCMVICSKLAGKPGIWVSDPSRTLTMVNLNFNGTTYPVKLPQGDYLGASIKVD